MRPRTRWLEVMLIGVAIVCVGCAGRIGPTRYSNPQFDFGYIEKVAVLPLENLTGDDQAGERATRMMVTELLASGAVDVVEPGEVRAAFNRISGIGATPSTEQILELGRILGVQAVLFGSVSQSDNVRSGNLLIPVVTLDVHMVETETGAPVWATTHTERGGSVGTKLLGTGGEAISVTTRRCVRKLVHLLVR